MTWLGYVVYVILQNWLILLVTELVTKTHSIFTSVLHISTYFNIHILYKVSTLTEHRSTCIEDNFFLVLTFPHSIASLLRSSG